MRIVRYLAAAAVTSALALTPLATRAQQESSVNTYSPYTMHGLGNLNRSPISAFAGMAGASIGFRNDYATATGKEGFDTTFDTRVNVANPASLSGLPRRSFIFDVGMAGSNVYLRQRSGTELLKTSFNTFNFNNITIAFPLAPKLGFAFNVAPYSEVGYRVHTDDMSYLADLGVVRYFYNGEGDINEAKASLGWAPLRRVSIGIEANYLWGNIDRTYQAVILPYTGSGNYSQVSAGTNERVGRVFGALGVQVTPVSRAKTRLTVGATYRFGGRLDSEVTDYIPSGNIYGDSIRFSKLRSATYVPARVGVGAYLHRPKWAVGADYVYEGWADRNDPDTANDMRYVNSETFKIGGKYTPNRFDIRGKVGSFFNRMTYKAGFRTGTNYMEFRGVPMRESALTLGVDVPFKADNVSALSVGLELGRRGSLQKSLVREQYFRLNVGVTLFGRDYDDWFEKYKYN